MLTAAIRSAISIWSKRTMPWMTRKLMEIARKTGHERVVSVLEGCYNLEGSARSVGARVTTLIAG
jgi:acetoin utilization deacetylase AcuC-like enzyme